MLELERLNRPGLVSLVTPVALLFERLKGIEAILENPDDAPDRFLASHIPTIDAADDDSAALSLVQVCAALPVFRYRVGAADGTVIWNPLAESLAQFRDQHGKLTYWYDGTLHPPASHTENWIKGYLST